MAQSQSKAIIIPTHWRESFDTLPDKDVAALIRGAFAVSSGEEPPVMRGGAAALWPLLRELIVQNQQKYSDICEKRREAIQKRWENQKNETKNTNEIKPIQENTNVSGCTGLNYYTNTNTKVSKDTVLIPPTPSLGGLKRVDIVKKWLRRCVGRYYRRKASTPWSKSEDKKLDDIAARPEILAECREMMKFYRDGRYTYQRRDIVTLLNNWAGELDRARSFKAPGGGKGVTYGGANGISGKF